MLHRSFTLNAFRAGSRSDALSMDTSPSSSSRIIKPEFKKWGLLCSFLVTAVIVVTILCQLELSEGRVARENELVHLEDDLPSVNSAKLPFVDTVDAYSRWDKHVGCARFRKRHGYTNSTPPATLQNPVATCDHLKQKHVSIRVQSWTWIPDSLNNLYSCSCGLTCLWTKSAVLADEPDALFYELHRPPLERHRGEPLRVYIDLEPDRKPAPMQDLFVSYHHSSDVQATYAGALFHNQRNYYISPVKNKDVLVYWSSSRCLPGRQQIASSFLPRISHHSFGKCLNNVGGEDATFEMYPNCKPGNPEGSWSQHLHCAMSHYKFVLAIENTMTESYVTEKLFYALDAGSVPIYFGAPNVLELVPPNSIIDGSKFSSMEELATYVKDLAEDPVRYAEFHAWRRCGVMGNYYWTRALSLDTLPCRLCTHISSLGGKMKP